MKAFKPYGAMRFGQDEPEDIQDPEAGPDPGYDTVLPEEELEYIDAGSGPLSIPYTVGGALLSAAEITALFILWRRAGAKTWPWYVLAGFVGLRAFGALSSLAAPTYSDTPNA